jgi:hypothetical protein
MWIRIRGLGNPVFGMGKIGSGINIRDPGINIPDPQHWLDQWIRFRRIHEGLKSSVHNRSLFYRSCFEELYLLSEEREDSSYSWKPEKKFSYLIKFFATEINCFFVHKKPRPESGVNVSGSAIRGTCVFESDSNGNVNSVVDPE